MHNAILGHYDGWLCALETSTRSTEPIEDTVYWPLRRDRREVWEEDLGKNLLPHQPYGYDVKIGGFWTTLRLADGGKTKAIHVESQAVPRPKRYKEVRWAHGRWQRYDRRKGWCNV